MKKKSPQKNDFENKLQSIENIVEKIEKNTLPLEEALSQYEKAVQAIAELQERLNEAEQRVKILTQENNPQKTSLLTEDNEAISNDKSR